MVSGRADPDGELSPVALELRVHGVHGTPPASMLGVDRSDVEQVAGDGLTGFYRSRSGNLPYRVPKAGLAVEVYSWGTLTSGTRGLFGWVLRALWLLLLPFALVNMAYWARLGLGQKGSGSRLGASALRVASVLLTMFLVITAATICVDMVGWQCFRGGSPACPGLPGWFGWLGRRTPGQRLAIASLGPLLLITVFVLLSNTSVSRYESTPDPVGDDLRGARRHDRLDPDGHPSDTRPQGPVLLHEDLFTGVERTKVLRNVHLVAALATVVAFVDVHLLKVVHPGDWRMVFVVPLGLAAALLVAALVVACTTLPGDVEAQLMPRASTGRTHRAWTGRSLVLAGMSLTVAQLVLLYVLPAAPVDELQDYFGRNAWFAALFIALTSLHLFVFAGGRLSGWRRYVAPLILPVVLTVGYVVVRVASDGSNPQAKDGSAAKDAADHGTQVALLVWLVALAVFAMLALWHYGLGHDARTKVGEGTADKQQALFARSAFAGAGASVLLAAAVWTALLFSTAAVIGSANVLNGQAPVTLLVTQLPAVERPPPVNPGEHGARRPDLTVSGRVVISGAVYTHQGGRLVIYSGNVLVTSAWRGNPLSSQVPLRALDKGTRLHDEVLAVPETNVELHDSCDYDNAAPRLKAVTRAGGYVCQASGGQNDFNRAVAVTVPDGLVRVDAPTSAVHLVLRQPGYTPLVVPSVMVWAPVAQTVWLLVVALAVAGCFLRFRRARRLILEESEADSPIPEWDRAGAGNTRAVAAFAHRAERILDVVGFVTSPVALAVIVFSALLQPPWQVFGHLDVLSDLSLYVVWGAAALLVLLGSQIRTSDSVRRAVGVIWDLATFWPRAAHPFSPPCYAERIVPEITRRALWALSVSKGRSVVLSGHSQGSLVLLTVAARLPRLDGFRLITYGSQIRALYGRFFPCVFSPEVVGYEATTGPMTLGDAHPDLATDLVEPSAPPEDSVRYRFEGSRRWINLFRRTDPLGFRVFSDSDSGIDVPTLEVPRAEMGDAGPPIKGHSDYQHSPEYRAHVREWTGEDLVGYPGGTTDVRPLPAP